MRSNPIEASLSQKDINNIKKATDNILQSESKVSDDELFTLACALVQSSKKFDVEDGINIFDNLCKNGSDQRDALFFLGVGHFRLSNDDEALVYVDKLLSFEPQNRQANALKTKIIKTREREGRFTLLSVTAASTVLFGAIVGALVYGIGKKS